MFGKVGRNALCIYTVTDAMREAAGTGSFASDDDNYYRRHRYNEQRGEVFCSLRRNREVARIGTSNGMGSRPLAR